MIKKCSKCEATFTCKNEARGCWCENIKLSTQQLAYLKENYENCLCPKCLKEFEKLSNLPFVGPTTVEYSITPHGLSLEKVLDELHFWGLAHRKKVIGK